MGSAPRGRTEQSGKPNLLAHIDRLWAVNAVNGGQGNLETDGATIDQALNRDYHNAFDRELSRLKALQNRQRRGYDFQDFVGSLFKYRHFNVAPSPGTARPRQTDLLATRGSDYSQSHASAAYSGHHQ
jgi:hypothetical protein